MKKSIIFLFVFTAYINNLTAQSKVIHGFVIDSISQTYLSGVSVINLNSSYRARTNQAGRFGINAVIGDKIQFVLPGYENKTLNYTQFYYELDTIKILMNPIITTLQDVVVSAYNYIDYQRDSTQRINDFIAANGTLKKTFDNNNTGPGLGISIDNLFGKKEKRKRRAYAQLQEWEEEHYIRFRYNPVLLKSLTGLKGDDLEKFMQKTQPTYKWLRNHTTHDDMLYYINNEMKKMNR